MNSSCLSLVSLACILSLSSGCGHGPNLVTRPITPEHFQFTTVVKPRRTEPYGWRAVCIHARLTHGNSGATDVCKFEVGLPVYNADQGEIPLETAQDIAAEEANRASYRILSQAHPGAMLAMLCNDFKALYEKLLSERIGGARVGKCVTAGTKVVHFGIPDECEP